MKVFENQDFKPIFPTKQYAVDMKIFEDLNNKKTDFFPVVVITEAIYMRGTNFRGNITLLMCTTFASKYEQE